MRYSKKSWIYVFLIFNLSSLSAQTTILFYNQSFNIIDSMLIGIKPQSFKDAVFVTENAYFEGQLDYRQNNKEIETLVKLTNAVSSNNPIIYTEADKDNVIKHGALFKVITDTIPVAIDS